MSFIEDLEELFWAWRDFAFVWGFASGVKGDIIDRDELVKLISHLFEDVDWRERNYSKDIMDKLLFTQEKEIMELERKGKAPVKDVSKTVAEIKKFLEGEEKR